MKIAIPLTDGKLSLHFGHSERFAFIDVDSIEKKILKREDIVAPPHEPGRLPQWLMDRGVNLIIVGGIGNKAQELFKQQGIQVVMGASVEIPEILVKDYLAGTLRTGVNVCDHE